jgi:hypothetical protein
MGRVGARRPGRPRSAVRFLIERLAIWDEYEVDVKDVIAVPDGRVVSLVAHSGKFTRTNNYEDRAEALEAIGLS